MKAMKVVPAREAAGSMCEDERAVRDSGRRSYTVEQAARVWGWPASSLYAEVAAGRLHASVRAGTAKGMRVTGMEMERWMAEELVAR